MTVTVAEAIEQLQQLDLTEEIFFVALQADDFLDGFSKCSAEGFRSATKNVGEDIHEDVYYGLEKAVYAAMGWGKPEPIDKCADVCVCGGSN